MDLTIKNFEKIQEEIYWDNYDKQIESNTIDFNKSINEIKRIENTKNMILSINSDNYWDIFEEVVKNS